MTPSKAFPWLVALFCPLTLLCNGARADRNPLDQRQQMSAWQDFVQDVEDFFGFGDHVTKWSEIASWKGVGGRFAAGYGKEGHLLALYDLSYPELLSPVTLGQVGGKNFSGPALIGAWEEAKKNEPRLPADVRHAIDAMGNLPEAVLRAGVISPGWWKKLPWLSRRATEPESFTLADLDPVRMSLGGDFVSKLRDLLREILYGQDSDAPLNRQGSQALAAASDSEILRSLRFVRTGASEYRIVFQAPASVSGLGGPLPPRKLLDLQGTKNGIYDNIQVEGLVYGLSELVTLIPSPVISALTATAISRLGRYFKMTQTEHLEMVRELLTETLEGSHLDPVLAGISEDDRDAIIRAFMWTRVTPEDFWEWLFSTPLSSWQSQRDKDSRCGARSRRWLEAHGDWVTNLNSRFVLTTDPASQRELYVLADVCAGGNTPPELSIDYADPLANAVDRWTLEMQGVGVEFATNLIPTFGFAVMAAYDFLVQDPVDNAQYWESRLMQHLEARDNAAAWRTELSILTAQRINPLEIDRARMLELIAARRRMIGI